MSLGTLEEQRYTLMEQGNELVSQFEASLHRQGDLVVAKADIHGWAQVSESAMGEFMIPKGTQLEVLADDGVDVLVRWQGQVVAVEPHKVK